MSWRVARSLDVLLGEVNAAAPLRSKVSDGSIGDAAHATRDSDHNPWVIVGGQGVVRARDFTHDPQHGLDCGLLADRLAAIVATGSHAAARSGAYVIWRRRIVSFDRRHEGWRTYSGSNPHEKHLHLSVATDPSGFDSTQPWGVMTTTAPLPSEEDLTVMPTMRELKDDLVPVIVNQIMQRKLRRDGLTVASALRRAALTQAMLDELPSTVADVVADTVIERVTASLSAGDTLSRADVHRAARGGAERAVRAVFGALDESDGPDRQQ